MKARLAIVGAVAATVAALSPTAQAAPCGPTASVLCTTPQGASCVVDVTSVCVGAAGGQCSELVQSGCEDNNPNWDWCGVWVGPLSYCVFGGN